MNERIWETTDCMTDSHLLVSLPQCHCHCHNMRNRIYVPGKEIVSHSILQDEITYPNPDTYCWNWRAHFFKLNESYCDLWRKWIQQGMMTSSKGNTLIFSLICAWTNGWVNNRDASDLKRHRAHYDATVMTNGCIHVKCITLCWFSDRTNDYETVS